MLSALCLPLCGFTFDADSSLKELTLPYINTYECVSATLGERDLLEGMEYIRITFENDRQLEMCYKPVDGELHRYVCDYTCDQDGTFTAEIGLLGYTFRQSAKIEGGKFTICMPVLSRPLIMIFEVK